MFKRWIFGATLAGLGSACIASSVPDPRPPVESGTPWPEVLTALEATICIRTFEPADRSPYTLALFADNCELPPATTPLGRAIEFAWADATPFLISLDQVDRAAQEAVGEGPSTEELLARVRSIYLGEPFLRALVPRLEQAMAAEGLECRDCPTFASPSEWHASWDELAPYVAAHIWPDPVITPRDERGEPIGEPNYTMHVCGGFNGVSEIPNPDPQLVQAGFLAAFHSEVVHRKARTHLDGIIADDAFVELRDDEARTRFLRDHLAPLLLADEEIRSAACAVIEGFRADLGLVVTGC